MIDRRNRIALGQTNAKRREDDFLERGKASEAGERNQRCDRIFSEHSREID